MSDILALDFGYDDNVRSSIKGAKRAIESRIDDYTGIKNELNGIDSNTGNLSNANSYLKKKINALQEKADRLGQFEVAVRDFNDFAEDQDKLVANRIKKETKSFCKREGIPNGFLYTVCAVIGDGLKWLKGKVSKVIESVKSWVSNAWQTVKKWYEDNKYWIDIVVDVIAVVASVAALVASGGVAAFIFAAWGLAKAGMDLYYDSKAYKAYKEGDYEKYSELSEKGLKDVMTKYMGEAGEIIYGGMEIASAVYGIYKIGKSVKTVFKDYKLLNAPLQDNLASTMLTSSTKSQIIKTDIITSVYKTIGITSLDSATGHIRFTDIKSTIQSIGNIASATQFGINAFTNIFNSDSVGGYFKSTIKIASTVDKLFTNTGDLLGKAAQKIFTNNLMCAAA